MSVKKIWRFSIQVECDTKRAAILALSRMTNHAKSDGTKISTSPIYGSRKYRRKGDL